MKFRFIYLLMFSTFAYLVLSGRSSGAAAAGVGGNTGAPSEGLCSNCHGGGGFSPSISIQLLSGGSPVTSYTAGQSYTLRITVAGGNRYGSQAVVLNSSNNSVGSLSSPSSNGRISAANGRSYLEHNSTSVSGVFTATWTAPAAGTGTVTIYGVGLAADGTGGTGGDNTINSSISISENVVTTISYPNASYCQSATNPSPTITGTQGGTFSASPSGLNFVSSSTGQINLQTSAAGTYTISYTHSGGSTSTSVTINPQPTATVSYAAVSFCQNGSNPSPTITGSTGGTFSSSPSGLVLNSSTGEINLASSVVGNYSVSYVLGGTCPSTVTNNISITAATSSAFSYPNSSYCQGASNPSPTITGAAGGSFGSSAGLSFANSSTGQIDLASSTAGAYSITYTSPAPCPSSSVFNLTVTARPSATISYPSSQFCQNGAIATASVQGAAGGSFGSSAGLDINSNTGAINPNNSLQGSYTVSYSVGNCGVISSQSVQILPVEQATISYSSATYCQSQPNPSAAIAGAQGGSFSSSPSGLILNSSTGEIGLAASNVGSYQIIYSSAGLCTGFDTVQINVSTAGSAEFSYVSDSICNNTADSVRPSIAGISGGIFSSSPNLVLNPQTGSIDLQSSPAGNYEIFYNVGGSCPASDSLTLEIVQGDSAFFYYDTTNASNSEFFNGVWYFCDYLIDTAIITAGQGGRFSYQVLNGVVFDNPPFFDSLSGSMYLRDAIVNDTHGLAVIRIDYQTSGICPDTFSQVINMRLGPCGSVGRTAAALQNPYLLYPNPAQNLLTLQNPRYSGRLEYYIYNLYGQIVASQELDFEQKTQLDISQLAAGLYMVEIRQADGSSGSYKFLKQ